MQEADIQYLNMTSRPNSEFRMSQLSGSYSVRSDMTAWEDLPTLQAQASTKTKEAQSVLQHCVQLETELESGTT